MKAQLLRRLISLEQTHVAQPGVEPLTIVVDSIPPDYALGPGERIVTDELERNTLMVAVSERITTDRTDCGRKAPLCAER